MFFQTNLKQFDRPCGLVFHQALDLPPATDERSNESGKYSLRHVIAGYIRNSVLNSLTLADVQVSSASKMWMVVPRDQTHLWIIMPFNGREIDVELLDNAGVQGVEVHNENVGVPQTPLRFEDETTLIFS